MNVEHPAAFVSTGQLPPPERVRILGLARLERPDERVQPGRPFRHPRRRRSWRRWLDTLLTESDEFTT
jgi:hypothetical protein